MRRIPFAACSTKCLARQCFVRKSFGITAAGQTRNAIPSRRIRPYFSTPRRRLTNTTSFLMTIPPRQILTRFFSVANGMNMAKPSMPVMRTGSVINDGHKKGVPIADVWDIPLLNPKAKERVGYPTQKPILLLERIIGLVTSPGDVGARPIFWQRHDTGGGELTVATRWALTWLAEAVGVGKAAAVEPFKTSSELLRKGRDSYNQTDEEVLATCTACRIVPFSGIAVLMQFSKCRRVRIPF